MTRDRNASIFRGRTGLALIDDIAMGEWTHRELAAQLGTSPEMITAFANEHERDIAEVRAWLGSKLRTDAAGLWVARKRERLAEYQADIEDLEAVIKVMREPGALPGYDLGSKRHFNVLRAKLALMKAVADEVEPRRSASTKPEEDRNVVRYIIEADDITAALS